MKDISKEAEEFFEEGNRVLKEDKYDKAIRHFDKAISRHSDYAEAWYNKGLAHTLKGEPKEAIRAHKKATDLDPEIEEKIDDF